MVALWAATEKVVPIDDSGRLDGEYDKVRSDALRFKEDEDGGLHEEDRAGRSACVAATLSDVLGPIAIQAAEEVRWLQICAFLACLRIP